MTKTLICVVACAWGTLLPTLAVAEEAASSPQKASTDAAESISSDDAASAPEKGSREYLVALVQEGAVLYDDKKYSEALSKLREAYGLNPSPTIGLVLAHCYRDSGQLGNAIDAYALVAAAEITESTHPRVVDAVEQGKSEHDRLQSRAVWLTLTVQGPSQFTVTFNGQTVEPHHSGAYVLLPGMYAIHLTAPGHVEKEFEFVAQPGQRPEQVVALVPVAPAQAPVVVAPPTPAPPAAVQPAPVKDPAVDGERTGAFKALAWTSVAGGFMGVLAGTGLVMYAWTENERSNDYCDGNICSPEAASSIENARRAANGATLAYSIGGGLMAVGVGLFVYDAVHKRKYEKRRRNQAQVYLTPTGARLAGTF